ncbi:hypothetical protein DFP72DRAFT_1063583 [Ephemerocybe angulata]|uniref:J domain-containing protein n=1 Tax=Ephemerocybe angulata TaxID=980116 RepID=A0A8H6MC98_9AGAR|nr:hypothetical protein DFP72DRAFT_1063583 [Tulosesus angulatus]
MSSDWGRCLNPNCMFGCGMFVSADLFSEEIIPRQKCFCGCYGMQHTAPGSAQASNPKASKVTDSSSRDLEEEKKHVPLKSVNEAARMAKERIQKKEREDARHEAAFDTSSKSGFASGKRKKKSSKKETKKADKKADSPRPPSASAKREATVAKRTPAVPKLLAEEKLYFRIVLVHDTRAVHHESILFLQPTPTMLRIYQVYGYMVTLQLLATMSPFEIYWAISGAFIGTKFIGADRSKLRDFNLLIRMKQKKGQKEYLTPLETRVGGELSYSDIASSRLPYHRGGLTRTEFKNIVYISLNKENSNIDVPGLKFARSPDSDEDDEDESDEEEDSKSARRKTRSKGKKKSPAPWDSDSDSGSGSEPDSHSNDDDDDENNSDNEDNQHARKRRRNVSPEPDAEDAHHTEEYVPGVPPLHMSSFVTAHRFAVNIVGVSGNSWWPPSTSYPYTRPLRLLDTVVTPAVLALQGSVTLANLEVVHDSLTVLFSSLTGIIELSKDTTDEEGFKRDFRLGPHGLSPIINSMNDLYSLLEDSVENVLGGEECNKLVDTMEPTATAIISLVLAFRDRTKRHLYDPPGFRELRSAMNTHIAYFGEATEDEALLILSLSVDTASISDFKTALMADFLSLDDASKIGSSVLLTGRYGITGMIEQVIDPLLDDLPLSHHMYDALFALLQPFCATLAHKISNYKKSHGKRPANARSGSVKPEHHQEEGGPDDGSDSARKYNTRQGGIGGNTGTSGSGNSTHDPMFVASDSESDSERPCGSPRKFDRRSSSGTGSYPSMDAKYKKENPQGGASASAQGFPPSADSSSNARPKTKPRPRPVPPKPKKEPPAKIPKRTVPFDLKVESVSQIIAELDAIARKVSIPTLLRTIGTYLVHPNPTKRRSWSFFEDSTSARTWRKMQLVYHPDKNVRGEIDERTLELFIAVVKLVNSHIM